MQPSDDTLLALIDHAPFGALNALARTCRLTAARVRLQEFPPGALIVDPVADRYVSDGDSPVLPNGKKHGFYSQIVAVVRIGVSMFDHEEHRSWYCRGKHYRSTTLMDSATYYYTERTPSLVVIVTNVSVRLSTSKYTAKKADPGGVVLLRVGGFTADTTIPWPDTDTWGLFAWFALNEQALSEQALKLM